MAGILNRLKKVFSGDEEVVGGLDEACSSSSMADLADLEGVEFVNARPVPRINANLSEDSVFSDVSDLPANKKVIKKRKAAGLTYEALNEHCKNVESKYETPKRQNKKVFSPTSGEFGKNLMSKYFYISFAHRSCTMWI
jgi:hypothetical protein